MLFLLLVAGALAGFVAGLLGIGGGVIFGPVLFFYFQALGVEDPVLTPLTLGSSLFCTLAASFSGAIAQQRKRSIDSRVALIAGGVAALAVTVMGLFVTTEPWYSRRVFQIVLGTVLLVAVAKMLRGKSASDTTPSVAQPRRDVGFLAVIGTAAGTLAAAAGVGGGVVLVPAFHTIVRLPFKVAAGTSTAAIVLITLTGVAVYAFKGLGAPGLPSGAFGYVDVPHALALAVPALATAQLGVQAAHRIDVRWVRYTFGALASVIALRLLWTAFTT